MTHGDIALVQHMQAYQADTTIGASFGGISDIHDLVVVPVRLPSAVHQSRSSGEGAPAMRELCDDNNNASEEDNQSKTSGETAPAKQIRS